MRLFFFTKPPITHLISVRISFCKNSQCKESALPDFRTGARFLQQPLSPGAEYGPRKAHKTQKPPAQDQKAIPWGRRSFCISITQKLFLVRINRCIFIHLRHILHLKSLHAQADLSVVFIEVNNLSLDLLTDG